MVDILINSETLRNTRDSTGMNQKEFSEFLGIGYRTYQNYETGHPIPDAKKELIAYKLRDIEKLNTQNLDGDELNAQLEETKQEYKALTTQFRKTGKDLIDLSLEVVDNWDELKKLKHIQNLIKLDVLEAERQEKIKR